MNRKKTAAIVGCLLVQLCVGIIYLWSVFKTSLVASYGWNDEAAKMVVSYMLMAFVLGCIAGGVLNDRRGPRFTAFAGVLLFSAGVGLTALLRPGRAWVIYLTYSVLGGFGSGVAYNACLPCIQNWFPGRRGFASGLAAAAFGLSTVVFTPLSRALMNAFTDPATGLVRFAPVFLLLAAVFLLLGLFGCFLIRSPETAAKSSGGDGRSYTLAEAVRKPAYWYLFAAMFFINGTWNLTVPLIYDLGLSRGLSDAAAIFAVSFTGIPNAAGRLAMAAVSDRIGRVPTLLLLAGMTFVGALLMIVAGGYGYIVVVAVIAFAYGGPSPVNAAFCTDFFGPRYAGTNYGVMMLALGLSSVFFNAVSSRLLHGAVGPTFVMAAVSALLAIAAVLLTQREHRRMDAQAALSPA